MKADIGVVIGRFQVAELTEGHKALLERVSQNHHRVVILIGVSSVRSTSNNPLDFATRQKMLAFECRNSTILPLEDQHDDETWSKKVDNTIRSVYPAGSVALYGGRDSFLPHYVGAFNLVSFEEITCRSGTEQRNKAAATSIDSTLFRQGAIYAASDRWPVCWPTVDIAVIDGGDVLLGRKSGRAEWQFLGGFADPESESFEQDARREVAEEAGIDINPHLEYICSAKIDDYRYRKERDKIKTIFFKATYMAGKAKAGDDIEEVKWFEISSLRMTDIIPSHRMLLAKLLSYLEVRKAMIEKAKMGDGIVH